MRESSVHKEAPVYLAVMSADLHEPGDPTRPPDIHVGAGEKSISQSSNNVEQTGEAPINLRQPNSGLLLESKTYDENTQSAFEITSVVDAADDLEQSKGMSDSFIMDDPKLRGQSESSESDETTKFLSVKVTQDTTMISEQVSEASDKLLPHEGASNGPMVAASIPRRFRRVNKYERGRWVIEDTSEPREAEERSESELKCVYVNQNSKGTLGRESPYLQRKKGEGGGVGEELVQLHSRSSSDLGGQGLETASTGERELHADRSSVVGETSNLSRNTSMSSLTTAGDKSVDGDHSNDRLSQLKDESEPEIAYPPAHVSTGNSTHLTVSSPPQHHRHGEAAVHPGTTNANAAATSDSGGEEGQHESRNKSVGVHRVEEALSHLNKELKQMLNENKEITRLKGENRKLDEKNRELQRQLDEKSRQLQGEKRQLDEKNREFQGEKRQLDEKNRDLQRQLDEKSREFQGDKKKLEDETQEQIAQLNGEITTLLQEVDELKTRLRTYEPTSQTDSGNS